MNTEPQAKPPDRRIAHLIKPLEGETTRGIGVSMTGVLDISNEPTDAHLPMTNLSLKPTHKPIRGYYEVSEMTTHAVKPIVRDDILAQLRALKPDLAERYAVSQVGIFGSVARNEAHEQSDIDIVVHMEPNILKRANLKAKLEKLFGKEVDVIRYRDLMNPYLKTRIDRDAIYA